MLDFELFWHKFYHLRENVRQTTILSIRHCELSFRNNIETRYGLDGPGIESRWRQQSRPALEPNQPPIQWVPDLSRGEAAGAWR